MKILQHKDKREYIPPKHLEVLHCYEEYVTMNTRIKRGVFKNLAKQIRRQSGRQSEGFNHDVDKNNL